MVSFNTTPSNIRRPFFSVEIDNSRATQGSGAIRYRGLMIAQMLASGTATPNTLYRVTSEATASTLAGRGSQGQRMARAWFAGNKSTELWMMFVSDPSGGAAATATVTFTGPVTADGTVSLYIGGRVVRAAVVKNPNPDPDAGIAAAADAAAAATSLAAAINADADALVTATHSLGVVTLTFKHKGVIGNEIDLRLNYYADSEALPAGLGATLTAFQSGSGAPDLGDDESGTLVAIGDEWHHIWAHGLNDDASMTAIENELAKRFGPTIQRQSHAFTAKNADLEYFSDPDNLRNSPHQTILPTDASPTPPDELAAHAASIAAYYGEIDPARPFQTLQLPYVKPGQPGARFTENVRNQLLFVGISTTYVDPSGVVCFERLITTYRKNALGVDDTSYLDLTTMLSLMYARTAFRSRIASKYPRHKLGNDGDYPAGEAIITPAIGKAEAIAWFDSLSTQSPVIFDVGTKQQFIRDIVCERNPSNPNRLDWLLPPDLINILIHGAANLQFIL